jgi:hypothetical protein
VKEVDPIYKNDINVKRDGRVVVNGETERVGDEADQT